MEGPPGWLVNIIKLLNFLFSVYAQNNRKNAEFYASFFKEVKKICNQYNVLNIYISGEFNVNLTGQSNRKAKDGKITREAKKNFKMLGIFAAPDKYIKSKWSHGTKISILDFVLLSKHLSKLILSYETIWGIDKASSDQILAS